MSLAPRRRARVRDTTDWPRLYDEGLRVQLTGELPEGSTLFVPFDRGRELLVVMVPIPGALIGVVRQLVGRAEQLHAMIGALVQLVLRGGRAW